MYIGFLPNKANARRQSLESIAGEHSTIIALESPHRLIASLKDILSVLGDRKIAICRELTKLHEEVFRGTISEAIQHFAEPRGEFTLVIEGKREKASPQLTEDIENQLYYMYTSGAKAKEAVASLAAETGLPRKTLYQAWLRLDKKQDSEKNSCQTPERS
jgi:16S rRNA (cytidine1402-2'-O)-methyltransferase